MEVPIEFSILLTKLDRVKLIDSIDTNIQAAEKILRNYLLKMFQTLKTDIQNGITKLSFSEYCPIPGMIFERFFQMLDKNGDQVLEKSEFIEGIILIFCGSIQQKVQFIFNFYDTNNDGSIEKEDVATILSHCPTAYIEKMIPSNSKNFNKKIPEDLNSIYSNRIQNQEEINLLLNEVFGENKSKINFPEFSNIIENVCSDLYISIYFLIRTSLPIQKNLPFLFKTSKLEIKPSNVVNSPNISPVKYLSGQKLIGEIFKNSPLMIKRKDLVKNSNLSSKVLEQYLFFKSSKTSKFQKSTFASSISKIGTNTNTEISDDIPSERLSSELSKPAYFDSIISHSILCPEKVAKAEKTGLQKLNLEKIEETKICPQCNEEIPIFLPMCPKCANLKSESYFSAPVFIFSNGYSLQRYQATIVNNEIFFYDIKDHNNYEMCFNMNGHYLINKPTIKDSENNDLYHLDLYRFDKSFSLYFTDKDEKEKWMKEIAKVIPSVQLSEVYQIKGVLGYGKFGIVRKAFHKISGKEVAIKIVCKKKRKERELELIRNEISVMNTCQHPNIIQIFDVLENEEYIYIVMENLTGGELLEYFLNNRNKIDEERIISILNSLCSALGYLHDLGIIHRDIKMNNIMLIDNSPKSDVKIVDFGLSKILIPKNYCEGALGTISFAAPELLLRKPYDFSVDIWSLGVCLFFMLSGDFPFGNDCEESSEIANAIVNDPPFFNNQHWENISLEAKDLVKKILDRNPKTRIILAGILQHQWVLNHNNKGKEDLTSISIKN